MNRYKKMEEPKFGPSNTTRLPFRISILHGNVVADENNESMR